MTMALKGGRTIDNMAKVRVIGRRDTVVAGEMESIDDDRRCKRKQDANIYVLVVYTDLINKRFLLYLFMLYIGIICMQYEEANAMTSLSRFFTRQYRHDDD